jgi:hypothetical protein
VIAYRLEFYARDWPENLAQGENSLRYEKLTNEQH